MTADSATPTSISTMTAVRASGCVVQRVSPDTARPSQTISNDGKPSYTTCARNKKTPGSQTATGRIEIWKIPNEANTIE